MRKLLLLPLRMCVGWGLSPRVLGLIGVTMLVLLRVTVGWHFYSEGIDKQDGTWSAAPFFANARGPFADQYHNLVWDADGAFRLDREQTLYDWALYREQISDHYGFNEDQRRQAQENFSKAVEQFDWVISENAADIEEFTLGRDRVTDLATKEKDLRDGVASLGGQRDTIRREWRQKGATALSQIDTIWQNYEAAQNSLASVEQKSVMPTFRLRRPRNIIDTSLLDEIVPYFDLAIGLCLLFGLLTPVAALAAAGFLGSVFLSQFPPVAGPTSSNYQLVECMACLVLAGTGAGRFAGLDYFLHLIVRRVWGTPAPPPS